MHIPDEPPDGAGPEQATSASGGADDERRGSKLTDRVLQVRHVRRATDWGKRKYTGSHAEYLWQRLDSMDFINQGMLFAATLLLCLFPFLIVGAALAGRDFATTLARHTGLNQQAAADLGGLFAPTAATHNAVVGSASGVFFVLGGIGAAAALERLYERAFEVDHRRWSIVRQLAWLVLFCAAGVLGGWAGPKTHHVGGPVLLAVAALVWFTAFWWLTMWGLLAGQVSWRRLFPSAFATGVLWLGMQVAFSLFFSRLIISENREYGPIGMIFALMTYLITVGIVVVAGAILGLVWQERNLSFAAALRTLRRTR